MVLVQFCCILLLCGLFHCNNDRRKSVIRDMARRNMCAKMTDDSSVASSWGPHQELKGNGQSEKEREVAHLIDRIKVILDETANPG